jgi:hypothetical protein
MNQTAHLTGRTPGHRMTVSQLRHDIRNQLNAIKLNSAVMSRRHTDPMSKEAFREIDAAADGINELVTRFLGDADAPSLLRAHADEAERAWTE